MALSEENWVLCPAVDDVDDDDDVDDVDDVDVVDDADDDDNNDDDVDEMGEKKSSSVCPNERHGESHRTLAMRSQNPSWPNIITYP